MPPLLAGGPHQRGDYGEGFALNVDRINLLARREPGRLSHQLEIRGMGLIVQNQRGLDHSELSGSVYSKS